MADIHSFADLYRVLQARKIAFLGVFFVTVLLTYGILFAIDFIPEPIEEDEPVAAVTGTNPIIEEGIEQELEPYIAEERVVPEPTVASPLPTKIIFDDLNRSVAVLNPTSRAISDLDEALLSGAVRHPDSADFSADGNIFILGHSSYLPNVLNRNFQAFNGIQELTWGDKIRVQTADTEYVYRVEKVYEAKASEVFVPETPGEARLTLATCNSFGSKDDRYMVEATLIGSYAL